MDCVGGKFWKKSDSGLQISLTDLVVYDMD